MARVLLGPEVIFKETTLPGAYLIELERIEDERGFFARSFCSAEFESRGLCGKWVQSNVSLNASAGTLRGMHWQSPPHSEAKLVRCTAGSIYDVIVDLRVGSATQYAWVGARLTAMNRLAFYVPEGFAHGFVTLEDETEVFYEMSTAYVPDAARGFRWNDPQVGIEWPITPKSISDRDAAYPILPALDTHGEEGQ